MTDYFNKNKIYRVREKVDRQGRTKYIVQAAESFMGAFFGLWNEYKKENDTEEEAVDQIAFIDKFRLKKERTVYRKVCH
jgi:hypothetical protein